MLEVLIAFTVLTVGATIMLQQLYAIMKYSERSLVKQAIVSQSLNEANMLSTIKWKEVSARQTEKELLITRTDEEGKEKKIKINNYKYEDVDVPMTVAFSPFQIFDFGGDGDFAVRLLQPGLLPDPESQIAVKGRSN